MRMNCGRWKNIQERCQGISDARSHMSAAIQWWRASRGFRKGVRMERLTNSDKEIPTLVNNKEYKMKTIDEIFWLRNDFCKTVFLTGEEAEAKLKEMEGAE